MARREAGGPRVTLPPRRKVLNWWPAVFYLGICALHLDLLIRGSDLAEMTQWLLMPALIALVLLICRSVRLRLVRVTLLALTVSWIGDSLPFLFPQEYDFVLRVSIFLIVMGCWATAFWPYRARSIINTRPQLLAPYSIALVGIVAVCAPGAGRLWPLLAVYGIALIGVSALATGLNGLATWGGIMFVIADGLIAINVFWPEFRLPLMDFWAMLAYLLAQALFTLGVLDLSGRKPKVLRIDDTV